MVQSCIHPDQIRDIAPSAGDSWVHLRLCLTCGHVGRCDSAKNKHATGHFHATNHTRVQSFEPGEDLAWCCLDHVFLEPA